MHIGKLAGAVLALACVATGAMAAEVVGQPVDWGLNFQAAGSEMMSELRSFHDWLLWLIFAISLFVLALLVWVMVRYNASANPTPGTRTHNTVLEVLWTAIPAIILVIVAVPSFRILYAVDVIPPADMTIKATGYQWYWGYEYPDHGDFYFDAFVVDSADEFEEPRPFARLLSTDLPVVVPVDNAIDLIRSHQIRQGKEPLGTEFPAPDFTKIAAGYGIESARVTTPDACDEALARAAAGNAPFLVEAHIDPIGYPTTPR